MRRDNMITQTYRAKFLSIFIRVLKWEVTLNCEEPDDLPHSLYLYLEPPNVNFRMQYASNSLMRVLIGTSE